MWVIGLYAIRTGDGLRLTVADAEFEVQMAVMWQIMHERRAVWRELAK